MPTLRRCFLVNDRTNYSKNKLLFPTFGLDGAPQWVMVVMMDCPCCKARHHSTDGAILASVPAFAAAVWVVGIGTFMTYWTLMCQLRRITIFRHRVAESSGRIDPHFVCAANLDPILCNSCFSHDRSAFSIDHSMANQRLYSRKIVDDIKNKPIWLSDISTYPVIAICTGACIGAFGYSKFVLL